MNDESFDTLLARCVECFDRGGEPAVRSLCADYPEQEAALLRAVATLCEFGLTGTTASLENELPRQLGEFEILSEVGRGGMGVVFKAHQPALDRVVALKVLPSAWIKEARQITRFRNEARAAATLDHPHIVRVHAVGEDAGTHFFAMHWVDGVSLRRVLEVLRNPAANDAEAQQVLEACIDGAAAAEVAHDAAGSASRAWLSSAVRLALQAAEGLQAAHAEGILHRDMKPGNLLVDRQGHLWVTDFGLAFFTRTPADLTRSGEFVGTLAYSSPEQVSGRTLADERSDVYSLGATLYEMLTLRSPFAATDQAALVRKIADQEPAAPRTLNPRIAFDLETIVLNALAKEPSQRYQSAAALARDLSAFLDGRSIEARRVSRLQRLLASCQRSPRRALAVLLIIVLTTIVAGVSWSAIRALRAERALALLSSQHLIDSHRSAAEALRNSLRAGRRSESLRRLAEATSELGRQPSLAETSAGLRADLRSDVLASAGLWEADEIPFPPVEEHGAQVQCFDEACSRHALRWNDQVIVRDALGHTLAARACADLVRIHLFSPDAAWLMFEARSGVQLWHIESGSLLPAPLPLRPHAWCFDHASKRFLVCLESNRLFACDLSAGRWSEVLEGPIPRTIAGCGRVNLLRFAPDDRRLALFAHTDSRLWIVSLDASQPALAVDLPDHPLSLAWSPEGTQLIVGGRFQDLIQIDAATGKLIESWAGHHAEVPAVTWSRSGDLVASSGWDGQVLVWERSGSPLVSIPVSTSTLWLAFAPGDRELGWSIADGDPRRPIRWRLRPPSSVRSFALGDHPYSAFPWASFHPSGRLIAVSTLQSLLFIDRERGTILGSRPSASPRRMRFLNDGSLFLAHVGDEAAKIVPMEIEGAVVRLGEEQRIGAATDGLREVDTNGDLICTWDRTSLRLFSRTGELLCSHAVQLDGAVHLRLAQGGRYAAFGSFRGAEIRVWDLERGELAFSESVPQRNANVAFSPDGRVLVVCRCDEHRVYEVGTWRLLGIIPRARRDALAGHAAFSPDGALLALPSTRSRLQVCDAHTLERLFELDMPDGGDASEPAFDVEGTELALVSAHRSLFIWDLRAIRRELRALGLDWSRVPIPPTAPPETTGLRFVSAR